MKPVRRVVLDVSVGLLAAGCAGEAPPLSSGPPATTWTLVASDEFEGPAGARVDDSKWRHDIGDGCDVGICGWGNQEKEYYTDATENVSLDGAGHLQIVARRAPSGLSCHYGPCQFTSGKITTRGKLLVAPGRVEARIKLPAGRGLWSAFWMLGDGWPTTPWPDVGELDIMENKGSQQSTTSSAIHGPGYSGATPFTHAHQLASGTVSDDFHVYAIEWDSSGAKFYVDDRMHYAVTRAALEERGRSILDRPYFVILNLAVGGHFDGEPTAETVFPATMLVDYVRVYRAAAR